MADILDYDTIGDMGNIMRSKRNMDFYGGGIEVTEKECNEYMKFVGDVIEKTKVIIKNWTHEEYLTTGDRSQN